jgi:hypothetical protein
MAPLQAYTHLFVCGRFYSQCSGDELAAMFGNILAAQYLFSVDKYMARQDVSKGTL